MQRRRLLQRSCDDPHLLFDRGQAVAVFCKLIDVLLNVDGSYLTNRHRSDLEALQRFCGGQETIIGGLLDAVCLEGVHPFCNVA